MGYDLFKKMNVPLTEQETTAYPPVYKTGAIRTYSYKNEWSFL